MTVADDLRLLAASGATLDAVEAAMRRLDDGSYGRCTGCGEGLAAADLAADPLLTTCGAHRPLPRVP